MTPVPTGLVRIFPTPTVPLEGVRHVVQDVDPETAERLCEPFSRHEALARFVTDPSLLPAGYEPPDPDHLVTDPPAPAPEPAGDEAPPTRRRSKPNPAPADAGAPDAEVTD